MNEIASALTNVIAYAGRIEQISSEDKNLGKENLGILNLGICRRAARLSGARPTPPDTRRRKLHGSRHLFQTRRLSEAKVMLSPESVKKNPGFRAPELHATSTDTRKPLGPSSLQVSLPAPVGATLDMARTSASP